MENTNENVKVEFEASETWKDDVKTEPETQVDPLSDGHSLNGVKVETSKSSDLCDADDELNSPKSKRLKKEDSEKTFNCERCLRKFPLESNLKAHLCTNVTRLKQLFTCRLCSKKCVDSSHLQTHMLNKHPIRLPKAKESNVVPRTSTHVVFPDATFSEDPQNKMLKCKFCSESIEVSGLLEHYKLSHPNSKEANGTPRTSNLSNDTSNPKKYHYLMDQIKASSCSLCSKKFVDPSHLQTHMLNKHPNHHPEAKESNVVPRTSTHVVFPNETFSNDPQSKMLKCKFCYRKFEESGLLEHYNVSHPNSKEANEPRTSNPSSDTSNPKKYQNLLDHSKVFQCELCAYCSSRKTILKRHVLQNHPEADQEVLDRVEDLQLDCATCGNIFYSWMTLMNHVKYMHPSSPLNSASVPQNKKLYISDPLQCELCYQSHIVFLSMEELESHKRTKHRKLPDLVEIL